MASGNHIRHHILRTFQPQEFPLVDVNLHPQMLFSQTIREGHPHISAILSVLPELLPDCYGDTVGLS